MKSQYKKPTFSRKTASAPIKLPKEELKKTRKHLKTLLRNGKPHHLRNAERIAKYGFVGFSRNLLLSLGACFVITITLITLFATLSANLILNSVTDVMRDKIDITAYFKPETTKEALIQMANVLHTDDNIRSIKIADSHQELERFLKENANNPTILNAVQDSEMQEIMLKNMQATITIKLKDIDKIDSIKHLFTTNQLFKDNLDPNKPPSYDSKRAVIDTVKTWATIAKTSGLALGLIFLVISILVIFNTIRMAIFSRREEIYMMKLIGANPSFIKGPFLIEAETSGIVSGLIAATISVTLLHFALPFLTKYEFDTLLVSSLIQPPFIFLVFLSMIIIGALISAIAARLAIFKHMR